ncbi:DUF2088 domain-containing protein, partial [candidate division KSB3 bacterium]|nr:DUF2088 domain-containing protein [candidate division KSB3 bacterium]MBD3327622.1 DUF2088 domain-containing protein [candidate division KSB3 bacterium]
MATLCKHGDATMVIDQSQKEQLVEESVQAIIDQQGQVPKRMLLIPPDMTRLHSDAGNITQIIYKKFSSSIHIDIMPAIGSHFAMTEEEIREMYGAEIPLERFLVHDWKNEVTVLGEIPADEIQKISGVNEVDYPMKVAINKILFEGNYDLILSIGQVVPHEVIGMANYTKNVCVGVGGSDMINKSHFIGAVYGAEQIMGRVETPVRAVIDYAFKTFLGDLPIYFLMTVMEKADEGLLMRGFYCSDRHDDEAYRLAAKLSQQVNLDLLDSSVNKVVVYLDPSEFKSTWLGNKAVYRTRMILEDEGELIILAPGLREFGEDRENDRLIRKYGYRKTPEILKAVEENVELQESLGAAAHLIHGSSEGRFTITYCPGPRVSKAEIEGVGYRYRPYEDAAQT